MSDNNFIPLNQSTPIHNRWRQDKNQNVQQQRYDNRLHNGSNRGGYNQWRNNSRNGHGGNSSNNSFSQERNNIDAYILPSMLEDPWEHLRQTNQMNGHLTLDTTDT